MKKIFIMDLKEGMVSAEDTYTESGILIIPKGVVLTEPIINHLITLGIIQLEVEDEKVMPENKPEGLFSQNEIKRKEHFKELRKQYGGVRDSLNNTFGGILSKKIDKKQILSVVDETWDFFEKNNVGADILTVLYSMHDYSDVTYMHSMNVGLIASLIGKWLGWSEKDVKTLNACGLFHDVGKMLIPKEILDKPGTLTDEEFKIMKSHTVLGYKTLKETGLDDVIINSAIMHHERCDGSGYPFGLTGNQIDRFSKVIAIADVYDAMTANRVYRQPVCPFDVIALFEEQGFPIFETEYLITFLHHMVNSYLHSRVELDNGEDAEIVLINKTRNSRPLVITSSGVPIDLSKETNIKIKQVYSA